MPMPSEAAALQRQDLAACRRMLANGSRTFMAASYLLPRRVRDHATALYAFCRLADDAIDENHASPEVLQSLQSRLDGIYDGRPADCAADRAMAAVVAANGIPRLLPGSLIEGFAWDAEARQYETLDELEAYATRVAGTVGAMMALLMGVRSEALLARACDLGIAMQLTNIARDVGEDARAGRLYLPRSWMREAGLDPDRWLEQPVFCGRLARVVEWLLAAADQFYRRSESGIAGLPADCRPGIAAARYLYAEIGHELMRQGLDSVSRRAVVGSGRKLQLLLAAARGAELSRVQLHAQAAHSARHIVAAAAAAEAMTPAGRDEAPPWWNFAARIVRVIELFERLERRDRTQRATEAMVDYDAAETAGP